MNLLERLTNFFAPDDCLMCGREGLLLCSACSLHLPALPGRCFGCNVVVNGVACADCLQTVGLQSLAAVTHYSDIGQALVARLKFGGNQSAARVMAQSMNLLYIPKGCIITHMPATAAHIRLRGYDQAALIARQLARAHGIQHLRLLARSGSQHQLGADRGQRLVQLQRSLRPINTAQILGKRVVVVDDVLTTGSSLRAAAAVLRRAGAVRIEGVVFAQAVATQQR